mgnify:CR=1 FL=1
MRILTLMLVLVGTGLCQAQQSVLITPRVQLEARVTDTEPAPQVQETVPQVAPPVQYVQPQPPQVYYIQPQQQRPDFMRLYMFNHMMHNATYARRGILFPRYVRRPDAMMRQYMVLRMMQQ